MNITTFMNIIFCLIMLNLLLVGIVSVLSIKALKQYKNYIDEKELEEVMKEFLKNNEEEIEVL